VNHQEMFALGLLILIVGIMIWGLWPIKEDDDA